MPAKKRTSIPDMRESEADSANAALSPLRNYPNIHHVETQYDPDGMPAFKAMLDEGIAVDPPEEWEMPYNEREGRLYFSGKGSYPCNPRRWEDIPSDALESLRKTCAIERLDEVFVIPWAVRGTTLFAGRMVITPNSVLALGSRAVSLWTEKPEPGIKASIAVGELAAIEDVAILLYGRLSFLSRDARLTVRYNTVARRELEPALLGLRKRLVGPAQPIPREGEFARLPLKWKNIVHSNLVCLEENASVAFRLAEGPGRSRRDEKRAHLLALNPCELVYVQDPLDYRYGSDSFIAPRSKISEVRTGGEHLSITSNNARFRLSMLPELQDAAASWL
jgi:hypothetical protein